MELTAKNIRDLYGLEIKVYTGNASLELVEHAHRSSYLETISEIADNEKLMFTAMGERILSDEKPERFYQGKIFLGRHVNGKVLKAARNYGDFFFLAATGDAEHENFAIDFWGKQKGMGAMLGDLTQKLGIGEIADKKTIKAAARVAMAEVMQYDAEDRVLMFGLMKILAEDFKEVGTYISLEKLMYVADLVPTLMKGKEDKRRDVLGKVLRKEFPYNEERRSRWTGDMMIEFTDTSL